MELQRKNLLKIIRNILLEADTVKRNLGKDSYSPIQKIAKLVDKKTPSGMCTYAFTMVSVPKVGINPKYEYDTPLGIYFYPLDEIRFYELKNNSLPFVSELKNFGLVRIKNPEKWLNVSDDSKTYNLKAFYYNAKKEIEKRLKASYDWPDFDHMLSAAKSRGKHWGVNSARNLFDFSYMMSSIICDSVDIRGLYPANLWSIILKSFGLEGIYDAGSGTIHESEPAQLVAFSKSAVEVIDLFDTNHFRRKSNEKYTIGEISEERKKLFEYVVNAYNSIGDELPPYAKDIQAFNDHIHRTTSVRRTDGELVIEFFGSILRNMEKKKENYRKLIDFHSKFVMENYEMIGVSYFTQALPFIDLESAEENFVIDRFSKNEKDIKKIAHAIARKISDFEQRTYEALMKGWYIKFFKKGAGDIFLKAVATSRFDFPDWVYTKIRGKINIFSRELHSNFKSPLAARDFAKGLKDYLKKWIYSHQPIDSRDIINVLEKIEAYNFSEESLLEIVSAIKFMIKNIDKINKNPYTHDITRIIFTFFKNENISAKNIEKIFSDLEKEEIEFFLGFNSTESFLYSFGKTKSKIATEIMLKRKMELDEYNYTYSEGMNIFIATSRTFFKNFFNSLRDTKSIIYMLTAAMQSYMEYSSTDYFAETLAHILFDIMPRGSAINELDFIEKSVRKNLESRESNNIAVFQLARKLLVELEENWH